jgi:hypothetical protein
MHLVFGWTSVKIFVIACAAYRLVGAQDLMLPAILADLAASFLSIRNYIRIEI